MIINELIVPTYRLMHSFIKRFSIFEKVPTKFWIRQFIYEKFKQFTYLLNRLVTKLDKWTITR